MVSKLTVWSLWVVATAILGILLHEAAHVAAAVLLGGTIDELTIFSLHLFPSLELSSWDGSLGSMSATVPNTKQILGIIDFAGSASTATIGLIILILLQKRFLSRFHPLFLTSALMLASDFVFYSTLPLLGLRHYVFIGGKESEPYQGFLQMGGSKPLFWIGLIAFVTVVIFLAWRTKTKREEQSVLT